MKQSAWRAAILGAAIGIALVGPSCTGSNVIVAERGQVSLQIGTTSTPAATYPFATVKLGQIKFRPTDPTASGTQTDALALLPTALTVDLNNAGQAVVSPVTVTAQTYALEEIKIDEVKLNVDPVAPTSRTCSGSTVLSLVTALGEESFVTPACTFDVPGTGSIVLGMTIDAAGLANLFASAFDCGSGVYTPPTSAQIQPFISFQCGP